MGNKVKVGDVVANAVFKNLNKLRNSEEVVEFNESRATATKQRNALLVKTYSQVKKLRDNGVEGIKNFNKQLKDDGAEFTSATSLELKCVRYVFGIANDDRRGSNYARVLSIAAEKKLGNGDFVTWVAERGIENIRRNSDGGDVKAEANRNEGQAKLSKARALDLTSAQYVKDGDTNFTLAIVRKNSDGNASIVGWANSATFVNAVLKSVGAAAIVKKEQEVVDNANKQNQQQAIESSTPASNQQPESVAA